jgi:hypothetical protein
MLLLLTASALESEVISNTEVISLLGLYNNTIEVTSYQGVNVAAPANITRNNGWFVGEAKFLDIHVLDANGVPVDVTGVSLLWAMRSAVRLKSHYREQGALVLEKTSVGGGITVIGDYTNDATTNTQRVRIAISPSDTTDLSAGNYAHALKNLDNQAIISEGTVELLLAAVR